MKKYLNLFLVLLLVSLFLPCCKKDSNAVKDYGAMVKGKIWTGEITYSGIPMGYYSAQFNADSTISWSELGGPYSGGKWSLRGKQLILNMTPSIQCKGDLSEDNQLINITNNNAYLTLNSGQLNSHGDMLLDGHTWKGSVRNYAGTKSTTISIAFYPNNKIEVDGGPFPAMLVNQPYERLGASIRFTNSGITFFGVIQPDVTEIKGQTHGGADQYNWQIIKQ